MFVQQVGHTRQSVCAPSLTEKIRKEITAYEEITLRGFRTPLTGDCSVDISMAMLVVLMGCRPVRCEQ